MQNETIDYKQKYLKYKAKYLELKNEIDGGWSWNSNYNYKKLVEWLKKDNTQFYYRGRLYIKTQNDNDNIPKFKLSKSTISFIKFFIDENNKKINYKIGSNDDINSQDKINLIENDNSIKKSFKCFQYIDNSYKKYTDIHNKEDGTKCK